MYTYSSKAAPPENQQGPGYTTHSDGRLYVFGGSSNGGASPNNKAMRYTPGTNTWEYRANLPQALWHPAVVSVGTKIYIIGGKKTDGTASGTVYEYDPVADTYTTKASMGTARHHAFNAEVDGKIYVIGGFTNTTTGSTVNEEYNPSTNTWTTKASLPVGAGDVDKAAVIDGKMYCIGGIDDDGVFIDLNQIYTPATNSWSTGAAMPTPRSSMGVGVLDDKIWVLAGSVSAGRIDLVEVYDPGTDSWDETQTDLTHPKENPAIGVIGNTLYISHGAETNYHETITLETMEEDITPDFAEKNITGGTISSVDGVVTITLTTGEGESPVLGCTDPAANNYNPAATVDNGSCTYSGGGTGAITFVDSDGSSANQQNYTFSGVNFGTASSDRYIVVGTGSNGATGPDGTVSSVTIGGVSATLIVKGVNSNDPTIATALYGALVPSGTSGTIVVNHSDTRGRCGIVVWAATGGSISVADTAHGGTSLASNQSFSNNIDIPAGGVACAVAWTSNSNSISARSWTGFTEDHWSAVESNAHVGGASKASATTQNGYSFGLSTTSSGSELMYSAASFSFS